MSATDPAPQPPRQPDPRAGKLCTSCNGLKPIPSLRHCQSPTCTWWRCKRCDSINDNAGRNMPGPHTPRRPAA